MKKLFKEWLTLLIFEKLLNRYFTMRTKKAQIFIIFELSFQRLTTFYLRILSA
jgi:hypothetical protein